MGRWPLSKFKWFWRWLLNYQDDSQRDPRREGKKEKSYKSYLLTDLILLPLDWIVWSFPNIHADHRQRLAHTILLAVLLHLTTPIDSPECIYRQILSSPEVDISPLFWFQRNSNILIQWMNRLNLVMKVVKVIQHLIQLWLSESLQQLQLWNSVWFTSLF